MKEVERIPRQARDAKRSLRGERGRLGVRRGCRLGDGRIVGDELDVNCVHHHHADLPFRDALDIEREARVGQHDEPALAIRDETAELDRIERGCGVSVSAKPQTRDENEEPRGLLGDEQGDAAIGGAHELMLRVDECDLALRHDRDLDGLVRALIAEATQPRVGQADDRL